MLKVFTLIVCLLFVFVGCSEYDKDELKVTNPDAIMRVTFTDKGFKLECDKLQVQNYRLGATVIAHYFVLNDTEGTIKPSIILDTKMSPDEFSQIEGKGYVLPPEGFESYMKVKNVEAIPPGELRIYDISFKIPKNTEVPDKFAFRTIISGNSGGFTQVAPWVWWTVDMR